MNAEGVLSRSDECASLFENRVVAYVDILGFSAVVEQAKTERVIFETLRDALTTINAQAQRVEEYRQLCTPSPNTRRVSLLPRADVTMTAFSDCYLLSDKASDDEGDDISPWHLMAAVQALGSNLLAKNILTRGAVVRGGAFHQDRVAFGPAIIEAYKLERDVANYPRILVTDDVREAISRDDQTFWSGQLLLKDTDGCSFINVITPPLSRWTTLSNDDDVSRPDKCEFLRIIRRFLEIRLRKSRDNLRHLSKIRWLIHHFNLAAEEHGLAISEGMEHSV